MVDERVDLGSAAIAVEEERGVEAAVQPCLEDLADAPGLEDGTAQRVELELIRGADPEQATEQAGSLTALKSSTHSSPAIRRTASRVPASSRNRRASSRSRTGASA